MISYRVLQNGPVDARACAEDACACREASDRQCRSTLSSATRENRYPGSDCIIHWCIYPAPRKDAILQKKRYRHETLLIPASPRQLPVTAAAGFMVVHHADGLHEGMADGRTCKATAMRLQGLAHCPGFAGLGRDRLPARPAVLQGSAIDAAPDENVKGTVLRADIKHGPGRVDRGRDLQPLAHDAGIRRQLNLPALAESCQAFGVEAIAGTATGARLFRIVLQL